MKTLQQLYTEIMGSDELKKAFVEAGKSGKVMDFLKAHGCEATAEDIKAFLKEKADQPLSDDELDNVAGGECTGESITEVCTSVCSFGLICAAEAVISAVEGHVGQRKGDERRICNTTGS